jgi:putative peptide maturation dehydrogenase
VALFRRSVYAFFTWHDGTFLDLEQLLRGSLTPAPYRWVLGLSALSGAAVPLTEGDIALLGSLPSDRWPAPDEAADADQDRLLQLARAGLVVCDDDDPELQELRRRDEQLADGQWNVYAALYHGLTRWHDVEVRQPFDDGPRELAAFVQEHGPPPPAFHPARGDGAITKLSDPGLERPFFDLLACRHTTRSFDREAELTADELSTVLFQVFGCHGYAPVLEEVVALKRTSPSGGGLHPIEAYPLLLRVEGLTPGLYHYRSQDHALQLVEALEVDEAADLAGRITCGQSYFASAAALFVLTARFQRTFWKYRKHQKAYSVVLMDAGHLSQTLYLVCEALGLGAFVTAAINGADIEERLGLEPFVEGAIALTGCGHPVPGGSPLEPSFIVRPQSTTKGEPEWPASPK